MKSSTSFRFSSSLLFFFIVAASIAGYSAVGDCTYWLTVKTGNVPRAGTHSRISVILGSSKGESVEVPDLKKWGIMPSGHVYFQNGRSDRFRGTAPCMGTGTAPCNINVTSDGSGEGPGWYLEFVIVSSNTIPKSPFRGKKTLFRFFQWLAIDESPYKLTESRQLCNSLATLRCGLGLQPEVC